MKKFALAFALTVASLAAAQAQTFVQVPDAASKPLRYVAGAGITYGGEKIVTVNYEDGDTIDIDGGGSIAFLAGLDYRVNPQFSVQGTVGYHVDNASGSNGDVRFERVPFELLGYYHVNDKVRVGGGLRYVTGTALRSSGAAEDIGDYKFKDSTSPVAEIEYLYSPQLGFKLRYVNDKFEEKRFGAEVKGDHVGVLMNFYF
ncbi:outer membrane beta-barrel protein [Massilia sp. CMS3.1]|uniref:outer membrane beta-barrel protein n=1 Tax=Massilia sp. CMS3.1 TaxID=3373083 RepID=UPI003EE53CFE